MGLNDEEWEKKLRQPPVSSHPISAAMRRNIHQKAVAVTKESANKRVNRVMVSLASIAAVCVAAGGVYFVTGHSFTQLVGTAPQQAASIGWSTTDVKQYIVQHERGHSVGDIRVIQASSTEGIKFAFVSFDLDGQLKYGSILDTRTQGTSLGTFTASQDKNNPLQFTETVGQNGFNLVTGVVVNDPQVKNVVITFKNGLVRTVPVVNSKFWYAGKVGATDTQSFTQHVLGVTDTGRIVENTTPSPSSGHSSGADNKVGVNNTNVVQTASTSSEMTWSVKSITVSPAKMTVNTQQLHAFRYVITMTPHGTVHGNPPNSGRPYTLQLYFSGKTQKLLGLKSDSVLLRLQDTASLTYEAIWESVYLPTYPKGTLTELSTNINDLSVQVQSSP